MDGSLLKCSECQASIEANDLFCPACGEQIRDSFAPGGPSISESGNETVSVVKPAIGATVVPSAKVLSALDKVQNLVKEKTRFETEDIRLVSERTEDHFYEIVVTYVLDAKVISKDIDGHFRSPARTVVAPVALLSAKSEAPERYPTAKNKIVSALKILDAKFDGIPAGAILVHENCHLQIQKCVRCGGGGRQSCRSCNGSGNTACPSCGGVGSTRNPCPFCYSTGRGACPACNGSGTVLQIVQTSTTDHNGVANYHIDTVQVPCGCGNGQVVCAQCAGSGTYIWSCSKCRGRGQVTCSKCSGSTEEACEPCSGSGKTGTAAWVDVHVAPAYAILGKTSWPEAAREIAESIDLSALSSVSPRFSQTSITENGNAVVARYAGVFNVVSLELECHAKRFNLVAYGKDLRWWTLDQIVEHLLEDDLAILSSAVMESSNDGLLSTRVDRILSPLKDVLCSEINAELVEIQLGTRSAGDIKDAVSEKYSNMMKHGVLSALGQISIRRAKYFFGMLAIAGVVLGRLSWLTPKPVWWAAALGTAFAFVGIAIHRHSVRNLLTESMGSADIAQRAVNLMKIGSKGKGHWEVPILLILPALLVFGVGWLSPKNNSLASNEATPQAQHQVPPRRDYVAAVPNEIKTEASEVPKSQMPSGSKDSLSGQRGMAPPRSGPQGTEVTAKQHSLPSPMAEDLYKKGMDAVDKLEFEKAFSFFEEAAGYGYLPARTRVAEMLFKGKGVRQNIPEAAALLKSAADEGYVRAQRLVAKDFYEGNQKYGRRRDLGQALKYAVKAADQGDKAAQWLAARIYSEGPQASRQMACKYARLAEGQGVPEAGHLARSICQT